MERKGIENYDERQKALRHKFGYQAFWVMIVLTFLNAYVCDMLYEWADPLVANLAVVILSVYFFGFRTIFSGAYTGDTVSEKRTAVLMPVALGIMIGGQLLTLPGLIYGPLHLFEDGRATIFFLSMMCPALLVPFAIAYYVKRSRDQRRNDEKE